MSQFPQFNPFGSGSSYGQQAFNGPASLDLSFLQFGRQRPPRQSQYQRGSAMLPPSTYKSFMRARTTGPNKHLNAPTGSLPGDGSPSDQPPGLLDQLGQAGFYDAFRQQGAADRQFERNNAQIQGFEDFLGREVPRFEQIAGEQAQAFRTEADSIDQRAQAQFDEFDQFRDATLNEQRQGIRGAVGAAQRAVSDFRSAIDEYADTSVQDASLSAAGIRESFQTQMKQISSGINPDGSRMTPEQQMAYRTEMQFNGERAVAGAIIPHFQRMNETLLSARANLSQLELAESQTRMVGAQSLASTAATFSGQRAQLQSEANQMQNLASNLRVQAASLKAGAHLTAVQFEMQGRQQMASLVQQNPESVVGIMPVIAAMFAASSAPGAKNLGGIQGPQSGINRTNPTNRNRTNGQQEMQFNFRPFNPLANRGRRSFG